MIERSCYVLQHNAVGFLPLATVRSPAEYRGEPLHMPDCPQDGVLRGGHTWFVLIYRLGYERVCN